MNTYLESLVYKENPDIFISKNNLILKVIQKMYVFSFTCNDLHSNMATYISSTSIMTVYLLFAQAHTYTKLAVPCYAQLNLM